jgi:hypothetical protein
MNNIPKLDLVTHKICGASHYCIEHHGTKKCP